MAPADSPAVILLSVDPQGGAADGRSFWPDIDDAGRTVAFVSTASNLDSRDNNFACGPFLSDNCGDLFLRDLKTGQTRLMSITPEGIQGSEKVHWASLSGDGSAIAFKTPAPELVSDDNNGVTDDFVVDVETGSIELVTRDWRGHAQPPVEDGRQCAPGCGEAFLSRDARYVAFATRSNNIVPGDENDLLDVFRLDRRTGDLVWVSQAPDAPQPDGKSTVQAVGAMSDDGRFVVFSSQASNLVDATLPSCDGTAFSAAGPGCWQVYVFDAHANSTTLVSATSGNTPGNGGSGRPMISGDGEWIYFQSQATNLHPEDDDGLLDVYGHHRSTGDLLLVSNAQRSHRGELSFQPSTNRDGSVVVFLTDRPEYGAKDGIHGLVATFRGSGEFVIVSRNLEGGWANGSVGRASMTADGRLVTFFGGPDDLVDQEEYTDLDGSDAFLATNPLFPDAVLPQVVVERAVAVGRGPTEETEGTGFVFLALFALATARLRPR